MLRLRVDVADHKTPRIITSGLAAGVVAGVVECAYAFAIGSGITGFGAALLFCVQVVAWTIAAAAPIVLGVHIVNHVARHPGRRFARSLRDPATDARWSVWVLAIGLTLAVYVTVLFLLADQQLVGKRPRGASLGAFVISAVGAIVVLGAVATLTARAVLRHVRLPSQRHTTLPRVVLALAAIGAIHVSIVATWLNSSLEIGFGVDLRIAIIPLVFITAWGALYRLSTTPLWSVIDAWSSKTRGALLGLFVAFVSVGLLAIGQRADADAALVSRSFVPRILLGLLHPPDDTPAFAQPMNAVASPESATPDPPEDPVPDRALTLDAAITSPGDEKPPPNSPRLKPNIVLITIDTLRPDHLGAYGYARPTSPEIDRFATTAVLFKRAYAAAPNTPRSIPSMLTSRYPSQIPWRNPANYPPLPKQVRTVAEDLERAGYRSHAILTHWYFRRERGLARGFHTWDTSLVDDDIETGREESAPRVTERARRLLARSKDAKKPFFLWVHYFEPHHFYILHKGSPTFGTAMMDKYDHEIRFVDREVGRLLKHLDDLALSKTTAVILTSDHGEAFGEHAKYWHGHALYDEQLRVPLLIRAPLARPSVRASETVASLVDLRPTIAELAGVNPIGPIAGRSLVAALRGEPLADRAVFAEILPQPNYSAHQRMVLRGTWKLIEDLRMRSVELYDLATDAREQRNEATRARAMADQLRASPAALNGTHP